MNTEKTEQKKTLPPAYRKIVDLLGPSADRVLDKFRFLRGQSARWDREDVLKMADAIAHTEDEFEMGIGRSKYASMENGQAKKLRTARRLCEGFWSATDTGQKRTAAWPWSKLRSYSA